MKGRLPFVMRGALSFLGSLLDTSTEVKCSPVSTLAAVYLSLIYLNLYRSLLLFEHHDMILNGGSD